MVSSVDQSDLILIRLAISLVVHETANSGQQAEKYTESSLQVIRSQILKFQVQLREKCIESSHPDLADLVLLLRHTTLVKLLHEGPDGSKLLTAHSLYDCQGQFQSLVLFRCHLIIK